jgi:hypothetical protein
MQINRWPENQAVGISGWTCLDCNFLTVWPRHNLMWLCPYRNVAATSEEAAGPIMPKSCLHQRQSASIMMALSHRRQYCPNHASQEVYCPNPASNPALIMPQYCLFLEGVMSIWSCWFPSEKCSSSPVWPTRLHLLLASLWCDPLRDCSTPIILEWNSHCLLLVRQVW